MRLFASPDAMVIAADAGEGHDRFLLFVHLLQKKALIDGILCADRQPVIAPARVLFLPCAGEGTRDCAVGLKVDLRILQHRA